jgi:hypothetical protein
MRTPPHPHLPLADTLIAVILLAVAAVAVLHGLAAVGHQNEAAEHAAMALEAPAATTVAERAAFDEMVEHAQIEGRIGRLLWWSVAAGAALVVAGVVAWRSRRFLGAWTGTVIWASLAMVAAGIASRSSVGLLGHTDPADIRWGIVVALEVLTAAAAAGLLAVLVSARRLDRAPAGDLRPLVAPSVRGR